MAKVVGAFVLFVHAAILLLILNTYSVPRYELWQTGLRSEGLITHFDFDEKGWMGQLSVHYPVQGIEHRSTVSAFFSDYQDGQAIQLLTSLDEPDQVSWAHPIRYWFPEIFGIGIWGGMLALMASHLFLLFRPFQYQAWGLLLIGIGLFCGALMYKSYESTKAFLAVSETVSSTIVSVAHETCTRKRKRNGREREVSYPCYRPTYAYNYGRGAYTKIAEKTFKERPIEGQLHELQIWTENPSIAKTAKLLPIWAYYLFIGFFVLLFVWGIWLLASFSTGSSLIIE